MMRRHLDRLLLLLLTVVVVIEVGWGLNVVARRSGGLLIVNVVVVVWTGNQRTGDLTLDVPLAIKIPYR